MRRISPLAALLLVLLIAFALRVFRLDFQSLWYDEAFSVYLAQFNFAEISARTAADIQPPLYYDLLHAWIALAGDSEFAVRFLSLFFGVLTIPLMYVTGKRLFGVGVALLASLIATLAPLYVWYSQETRMYTLITGLLLLSSYALLRALATRERSRWWTVFALANIAAVYTHYFAFVVIGFQIVYALAASLRAERAVAILKPALIACAGIALAFLPWTPFLLTRLGQDVSYWQGELKLDEAIRHIFISFSTGESVLEAQAQWVAVGWVALLVIGLVTRLGVRREQTELAGIGFGILYLLIPLVLLLFLFSRNPKFNARYLMIASPAFFLLLAAGLESLLALARSRNLAVRAVTAVAAVLAFAFIFSTAAFADTNAYFDAAFTRAQFREVAQYVDAHIEPGEVVLLTSGHMFPAFNYYYSGEAPQIRLPDDATLNTGHVLGYAAAQVLNRTLAGARGVWVVLWQDEVVDPNGFIPMLLSSQGREQPVPGASFYQVRLRHWTLSPNAHFSTEPQPAVARVANYANKVQLLGFDAPHPTPADVGASFKLYYQVLDTLGEDYQVALRVRDAAGNLWGKQDRRPAGYTFPTTRWKKGESLFGAFTVPLLPGAPAGDYFVEVTLYTASNQSGLDVLAPNDAPVGKTVKLGPIPVLAASAPATMAALNIQNTISEPVGPFTLLGYQLGRDKASAGERIPLTLYWRADRQPDKEYRFRLLLDNAPTEALPLANEQFPTSRWRAGEIVRGQYNIRIPADASAGAKPLILQLDGVTQANSGIALAPFTVEKTDRLFVKPATAVGQTAVFGNNRMALVGYTADQMLKAGETFKIALVWQALGSPGDKPYTMFVHLLDKNNQVVAQKDSQPVGGARPTTGWVENEFIVDSNELPVKPETAPGSYQIEIGWYDAVDFTRLLVLDPNGVPASDHVILKTSVLVQ